MVTSHRYALSRSYIQGEIKMQLGKTSVISLVVLILIAGVVGLIIPLFCGNSSFLQVIANAALVFTLAILILYTYYTYLIAREAWTPSASFALKPYPGTPYHFAFILQNHSKLSLNCWCNLNATVDGLPVSLGGFYSGESSFDLQPFGGGNGHFDINDIISKAKRSLQEMEQNAANSNQKEQLYLNIEFWYNPVGSSEIVRNPRQPHYFSFVHKVIVADF